MKFHLRRTLLWSAIGSIAILLATRNVQLVSLYGQDSAANAKSQPTNPVIQKFGSVVQFPNAAHQPRSGTKVIIDVTKGNDTAELNSAIEKVAKYLNICAGGGSKPADVEISVVFHGDATLVVLNHDAYVAKFKTPNNPNLDLLQQLHDHGVKLYVCGQSLLSKDAKPEEVSPFIETAVSAFTVVVNCQSDGSAYLSISK